MALMIQKLVRTQQSQQQLLTLQGSCQLFGLRHFSDAAPVKGKNKGLGSSRAEGTAPRFYKYVGVEPAPGQVRVPGVSMSSRPKMHIGQHDLCTGQWLADHTK